MKTMLAAFALVLIPAAAQDNSPLLKLVQTIPLVKAEGRIDHLAVDVKRARLYVTASGSDTVEVVDLKQGAVARSLTGFSKPKGALSPAGSNRVLVADGGGTLRILDAEGLNLISSVDLSGVPGALLYDAAARRIYAGFGDSLAVIDAATGRKLGEVKLPGQPEGFEAEKSGARIFVNLPGTNEVGREIRRPDLRQPPGYERDRRGGPRQAGGIEQDCGYLGAGELSDGARRSRPSTAGGRAQARQGFGAGYGFVGMGHRSGRERRHRRSALRRPPQARLRRLRDGQDPRIRRPDLRDGPDGPGSL